MPGLPSVAAQKQFFLRRFIFFKKDTILHTDFWKGYLGIDRKGYKHERVNHSDPDILYRPHFLDSSSTNRGKTSYQQKFFNIMAVLGETDGNIAS